MQKRLILGPQLLDLTINRLCQQLIENHGDFSDSVILGLQPKGIYLAENIQKRLESYVGQSVPLGYIDPTFHRDDFRRRDVPVTPNATKVPFLVEDKKVVLIDDVLFTGRTVRAAMDAMIAFGRPRKVELLTLINRKYSRDIPVEPNYIGKNVNTIENQRILVELVEQGFKKNTIWLINKEEN